MKLFKVSALQSIDFSHSNFQYGHSKLSDGSGYNGCYATHIVLRSGTHVVKLPETISDRCAVPVNCALATAMCAMENVPKVKSGRAFVQVGVFLMNVDGVISMTSNNGCTCL